MERGHIRGTDFQGEKRDEGRWREKGLRKSSGLKRLPRDLRKWWDLKLCTERGGGGEGADAEEMGVEARQMHPQEGEEEEWS